MRNVANVPDIHFIGGYLTSVAYLSQKAADIDGYSTTADHFRDNRMLPLYTTFRPTTLLDKIGRAIVFQLEVLEVRFDWSRIFDDLIIGGFVMI